MECNDELKEIDIRMKIIIRNCFYKNVNKMKKKGLVILLMIWEMFLILISLMKNEFSLVHALLLFRLFLKKCSATFMLVEPLTFFAV